MANPISPGSCGWCAGQGSTSTLSFGCMPGKVRHDPPTPCIWCEGTGRAGVGPVPSWAIQYQDGVIYSEADLRRAMADPPKFPTTAMDWIDRYRKADDPVTKATHRITTVDRTGRPAMATLVEAEAVKLWTELTGTAVARRQWQFASWTLLVDGKWLIVRSVAAPVVA